MCSIKIYDSSYLQNMSPNIINYKLNQNNKLSEYEISSSKNLQPKNNFCLVVVANPFNQNLWYFRRTTNVNALCMCNLAFF